MITSLRCNALSMAMPPKPIKKAKVIKVVTSKAPDKKAQTFFEIMKKTFKLHPNYSKTDGGFFKSV